ncbi:30S ribosomal protein S6 [Patescibacteria group bacterium]
MQRYEIMYLVSPKTKDEDLRPSADQIQELIKKHGGKITEEVEWGKKKLAYPIDHYRHGFYYILYFDLEPDKLADLEKDLKLTDYILRYLLTKHSHVSWAALEEQKKKAAERALAAKEEASADSAEESKESDSSQPKLTVEKIPAKETPLEKPADEPKPEPEAKPEPKPEPTKETTSEKESSEPLIEIDAEPKETEKEKEKQERKKSDKQEKAKLDELDKKLDEILDDDIIE